MNEQRFLHGMSSAEIAQRSLAACKIAIANVDHTPMMFETHLPNPLLCQHTFSTALGVEICTKCNVLESELETIGRILDGKDSKQ